eukprot:3929294-Prorocentrum_lima.AAC.1
MGSGPMQPRSGRGLQPPSIPLWLWSDLPGKPTWPGMPPGLVAGRRCGLPAGAPLVQLQPGLHLRC